MTSMLCGAWGMGEGLWEARNEVDKAFREMMRVSKNLLSDGAPECKGRS